MTESPASALPLDTRNAARGSVALTALTVFGRTLALGFVLVVTHHVSPDQFGRFSIVYALVLMAGMLADFGTTPAITREVARHPDQSDRILAGTALASFALGMVLWALIVGFAVAVGYGHQTVIDVLIGGASLPFSSTSTSFSAALDGHGLIARRTAVTLAQTLVITVGGAGAVWAGLGIRSAMIAMAAAPAAALVVSTRIAARQGIWHGGLRPSLATCRAVLRQAIPYAIIGGFGALLLRFDVTLLSVLHSRTETASYDLAQQMMEATLALSIAISQPALYLFSRRLAADDIDGAQRAFGVASRLVYLFGLPVAALVVALHDPMTRFVFGSRYRGVGMPLAIMASTSWLALIGGLQVSLIMSGERIWRGVKAACTVAIVSVIADAVLIGPFGADGAALVGAGTSVFVVVWLGRFHRRSMGLRTPLPPLRSLVAATGGGVAAWLTRGETVALAAAVGLIVYALLLVTTRTVTKADVTLADNIVRARTPEVVGQP